MDVHTEPFVCRSGYYHGFPNNVEYEFGNSVDQDVAMHWADCWIGDARGMGDSFPHSEERGLGARSSWGHVHRFKRVDSLGITGDHGR